MEPWFREDNRRLGRGPTQLKSALTNESPAFPCFHSPSIVCLVPPAHPLPDRPKEPLVHEEMSAARIRILVYYPCIDDDLI